jgi:hypothetical protein
MAVTIPIISEFNGKGISRAIEEFKQLEGAGKKAQFAIKKAAIPAAAALAGIAAAAVPAVSAASDLNETISKTNVIFGEAANEVQIFADTAAVSLGQTRQQALDAAATFGTFGKAAGLTGQDLASFSTDFTALASDLASFNNTSPEEAVQALGAALRGESEPLRRFGVLLSADAVAAEALAMGLVTTTINEDKLNIALQKVDIAFQKNQETVAKFGEDSIEAQKSRLALEQAEQSLNKALDGTTDKLTAQQKTLATQSLILKATTDAQGDFERTSDGLANSQRILTAQFKDLQAELGMILLPIVEKGTKILSGLTGAMADNKDITAVVIGVIAGLAAAVLAVNAAMRVYQATLVIVKVAQAALNLVMSANPIGLVVIAIGALVAALVLAYQKSETFRNAIDGMFRFVSFAIGQSVEAIKGWLNGVMAFYRSVFNGIANAWNNTIGKLSFKVPDWVPGLGGKGFGVPDIPRLADGGIVASPTLALIGEAGPEAVVPLSRMNQMGNVTININANVADERLGDVIVNALRQYNRRSGPINVAVA